MSVAFAARSCAVVREPGEAIVLNNSLDLRLLLLAAISALTLASCEGSSRSRAPESLAFSPANGPVGTLVTFTGANYSSATEVSIGGVDAVIVSKGKTQLRALVMPGATIGEVSVTRAADVLVGASAFTIDAASPPTTQLGERLITGDAISYSVALSADGNTALVAGSYYDGFEDIGVTSVYVRSNGAWVVEDASLDPAEGAPANYPVAVALNADGDTALVGGYDPGSVGAAWVFTRTNGVWSQQGAALVGSGSVDGSEQGRAVALSADGNTAAIGGPRDDDPDSFVAVGAAWVFTRSGGVWTQQGAKLVGTGATANAQQGSSVALSADGNTLAVGGPYDAFIPFASAAVGAAWVFTRADGAWSQQGEKLVGADVAGDSFQGETIALSADGDTLALGGSARGDSLSDGGVFVFVRSAGEWTQQGSKLTASDGFFPRLGLGFLSLRADGDLLAVTGPWGNGVWLFARSGGAWSQLGARMQGTGDEGQVDPDQRNGLALSSDGETMLIVGGQTDEDDGDELEGDESHGSLWSFGP